MTWGELKAALSTLSDEQLAKPCLWLGDERGGDVESVWTAVEDWIENEDGDVEPRSVFDDPESTRGAKVHIAAGDMRIMVE